MPIKRIVLKYPSAPTESFYTEEHMYVALDSGSGGYPVRSTISKRSRQLRSTSVNSMSSSR